MSVRVVRYEVPVDDVWHPLQLSGPIVHATCRGMTYVEFWVLASDQPADTRWFRAFRDDHEVPGDAIYRGTALSPTGPGPFSQPYGQFVWHLFETQDPREV